MFYKPQYNTETQTSDNNTENDCDLRHRQKDAQMHSKGIDTGYSQPGAKVDQFI
ncbi:MAG: hypothetical protein QGH82_08390 [Candidatus Woesearchaeota archaeon]|jgi:hypothetical protein|nr:hypothetical protein [Candidatus Woesearchaeota archaeon]